MPNPVESNPAGLFEWGRSLRETAGVPIAMRGILHTFATYATTETGGDIRPSVAALSERLNVSRSTVSKYISRAVDEGWLQRTESKKGLGVPSVYQLSIPTGGVRPHGHPREPEARGGVRPHGHPKESKAGGVSAHTDRGCPPERTGGVRVDGQGVSAREDTTSTSTSASTSSDTSTGWAAADEPQALELLDIAGLISADAARRGYGLGARHPTKGRRW